MEEEKKKLGDRILENIAPILLTLFIAVSAVFISMKENIAVINSEIDMQEGRLIAIEQRITDISNDLSTVKADTAYIRGALEVKTKMEK